MGRRGFEPTHSLVMVFEESTFVLTKAPAKAAAELTEPVVSDPSKKLDALQQPAPARKAKAVEPGD